MARGARRAGRAGAALVLRLGLEGGAGAGERELRAAGGARAGAEWVAGRARDADLALAVPPQSGVSRQHAVLASAPGSGELRVWDRGSRFGTWVLASGAGGRRGGGEVWERVGEGSPGRALAPGDVIRLGAPQDQLGGLNLEEIRLRVLAWGPEDHGGPPKTQEPSAPSANPRRLRRVAEPAPPGPAARRASQRLQSPPPQSPLKAPQPPRRSPRKRAQPRQEGGGAAAEEGVAGAGRGAAAIPEVEPAEEVPDSGGEEETPERATKRQRRAARRRAVPEAAAARERDAPPPGPKRRRAAPTSGDSAAAGPVPALPAAPAAFEAAQRSARAPGASAAEGQRRVGGPLFVLCPGKTFRKQELPPPPPPLPRPLSDFRNDGASTASLYAEYAEAERRERARAAAADALFRESAAAAARRKPRRARA